jgi:hypothetical protein
MEQTLQWTKGEPCAPHSISPRVRTEDTACVCVTPPLAPHLDMGQSCSLGRVAALVTASLCARVCGRYLLGLGNIVAYMEAATVALEGRSVHTLPPLPHDAHP